MVYQSNRIVFTRLLRKAYIGIQAKIMTESIKVSYQEMTTRFVSEENELWH
jgi:hypothetical protein